MAIEAIDFATLALSRLAQQYRDKPKYVELVTELCKLTQTYIDDPLEYLITLYDIDTAEGHNLDVIGEIVGQPRIIIDFDLLEFFGYDGATAAGTYSDLNNTNLGARYLSSGEDLGGDKTLSDPEYRIFIKSRILRNYSKSTPEDIIESAKLILGSDLVRYTEGVMTFDLEVLGDIDANDLALLQNYDILPRPAGVGIGSVSSIPVEITASGAGDVGTNNIYTENGIFNGKIEYDHIAGVPGNLNYMRIRADTDGTWLIIADRSLPPTGVIYTNPSTSKNPPKTLWVDAGGGLPVPTLSY